MKTMAIVLALWPLSLVAEDWQPLDGAAIMQVLTDQELVYDSAFQRFFASGRTLYNSGQDSWGYWTVRGDQYCSQWPPSDGWDCYDIAARRDAVRFVASDGGVTDGVLVIYDPEDADN